MNLDEAVSVHQKWKIRLGMIIEGNSADVLDPEVVGDDHRCEFGQRLLGEVDRLKAMPEYGRVVAEHLAFHREAASVLRKALGNDRKGAKADLEGRYAQQSQKLVAAILAFKQALP